MMEGYRALFARMRARGFAQGGERLRLGWRDKLALAGQSPAPGVIMRSTRG